MVAEIGLSLLIGVIIGGYTAGSGSDTESKEQKIWEWKAKEHQDGMLMCKAMCDNKVKLYTPVTGECKCTSSVND